MRENGIKPSKSAFLGTEEGRAMEIEREMLRYREQLRKQLNSRIEATGKKGMMTDDEYDRYEKGIEDKVNAERTRKQKEQGVSESARTRGQAQDNPWEWEKLTPVQRQQLPAGSWVKYKAKPGDPKADDKGYRYGIVPHREPQQAPQQRPPPVQVENDLGPDQALG
jgi:hypothetical protein